MNKWGFRARMQREKGLLDGVRPQSNFSSLPSLDGLSLGSPLPLRPNVINWHVTLEVGVCMYSPDSSLHYRYITCAQFN